MPFQPTLKHTLSCHTRAINTLRFSSDCSRLLSGGDDAALIIWDLKRQGSYQIVKVPLHGSVCSVIWTPLSSEEASETFVFGCADGTLFTYKKEPLPSQHFRICSTQQSFDAPIEELAFDPEHHHVASVSREGIKIHELDDQGRLVEIASETSEGKYTPHSVGFNKNGDEVLVSFMESHELCSFNVNLWELKWSTTLATQIGHAAITPSHDTLVVSNLEKGVNIYSLPPERMPVQIPRKSFTRKANQRGIPLLVSVSGQVIVVGTDCGVAQVFNDSAKELLDLPHWSYTESRVRGRWGKQWVNPAQKMVQIVTAHQHDNEYWIATGTGESEEKHGGGVDIKIWLLSRKERGNRRAQNAVAAAASYLFGQAIITILLALLAQATVSSLIDKSAAAKLSAIEAILELALTICDTLGLKGMRKVEVPEAVAPVIEMKTRNFWKPLKWLS